MNQTHKSWHVLAAALILTALFHHHDPGLNLWISEVLFLGWLFASRQISFGNKLINIALSGVILTSLATVLVYSAFAGWMHAISLLVLAGLLSSPDLRSLANALATGLVNIVMAQVVFVRRIRGLKVGKRNVGAALWRGRIFLIPILIIFVFISIYRGSSPVFNDLMEDTFGWLGERIERLLRNIDLKLINTFIVCILIAVVMFVRNQIREISGADAVALEELKRHRIRQKKHTLKMGLKNEFRATIFMLVVLNLLILVLNITDIQWVWFNFKWEGQYLKQFVHEGTWLLILSILISCIIVLYSFRRNLNFFSKNRSLKLLSYLWLLQNAILTVSVAIRNFYYIGYFSLAYKRIGVIIFLILTFIGLATVLIKVMKKKSAFYLIRTNALAWFMVLILSSTLPWDIIIAKYNFRHADRSFLHLNYMCTLSDKALPYLDHSLEDLMRLDSIQYREFDFGRSYRYMSPEEYHNVIEQRKQSFLMRHQKQDWLSWNLPAYLAYRKLSVN
jgi:hypothetical protein